MVKNTLTVFKLSFQNATGLKLSVDSLMEIISDHQPMLICLFETNLQKKEIRIAGYSLIIRNYR